MWVGHGDVGGFTGSVKNSIAVSELGYTKALGGRTISDFKTYKI